MNKLYKGSIDVTKIDKSKLFKGKKGTYLNVDIWVNDEPDKFGNHIGIQQQTEKGETKIYLGNAKALQQTASSAPSTNQPDDDLPF